MIKIATVCTGIGSPEQAIKELGWKHEISFGCELDKYARTTYAANHQANRMFTDMTKESWIGEEYKSDLFVGGIPCQAFSLAGKRLGELDPRGLLFYNFYDYVNKQRPKVFIIENVKGLLSDAKGTTFQNWIQLLGRSVNTQEIMFPHVDSLEYNLHWTVLNSKDFGVPQNRERVFLVGIRKDLPNDFRFPTGWNLDKRLKDVLETEVDEKYYLSDKMLNYLNTRKDNFNGGKINYKFDDDVASCINASSGLDISDNIILQGVLNDKGKIRETEISTCIDSNYGKGMDNHAQRTMIQEDNLILVGGIKKGEFRKGTVNEFAQAERVYDANGIMPALTSELGGRNNVQYEVIVPEATKKGYAIAKEGDSVNIKNIESKTRRGRVGNQIANTIETNQLQCVLQKRIRRLTPREVFRLQGFPDSFDISKVSDTQGYKQAGNTITVKVIKEICRNLESILL
jgi:DNA (cytosine-5)-methyltransferase 1